MNFEKTLAQDQALTEIMTRRSDITKEIDKDYFEWGLERFYGSIGHSKPIVHYAPSPLAAVKQAAVELKKQYPTQDLNWCEREALNNALFTCWTPGRAAYVEACAVVDLAINKEVGDTIKALAEQIGLIVVFKEECWVSDNCYRFSIQDRELHNETEAAWCWKDEFGIYALEGFHVDEQLVMAPHTQTLAQIKNEENAEKKRIRISRFGWERYLTESNAKLLDVATINLGDSSWVENLMHLPDEDITVLCTYDPSTKRPYSLEVSTDCTTTAQAQAFLGNHSAAFEGFKVKPDSKVIYPVLRT